MTPRRLRVAADEYDPSGVLGIVLRLSVSLAHRRGGRSRQIADEISSAARWARGGTASPNVSYIRIPPELLPPRRIWLAPARKYAYCAWERNRLTSSKASRPAASACAISGEPS